jgi:hypothetical protein
VGDSIVNVMASFRLLAIDNSISPVIDSDVHARKISSISRFRNR